MSSMGKEMTFARCCGQRMSAPTLRQVAGLHQGHRERCPGAPLARVVFQDLYQLKKQMVVFIIMEGIHTDHFMYCNKKAQLNIGNVLLVGTMPWSTIVCCLEEKLVDWGKLPQGLRNYVTVMSHNPETNRLKWSCPQGQRRSFISSLSNKSLPSIIS